MKNKIIINIMLIVAGIILGALGNYFLAGNNSTSELHTHDNEESLYSCGMHPNIIESEPGTCPICGMNLTPIKGSQKKESVESKDRKIIYWRAPMNPNEIYDDPGKSKMGMELVPVYDDEVGTSGVVTVDGSVLQSMNVKMEFVTNRTISSNIYTNGIVETDERKEFAVTTKLDGWVENLYINFVGQKVVKGQKLVDIYSPQLVAAQQELITAINYDISAAGSSQTEVVNNAKRKLIHLDIRKSDIEYIINTKQIKKYMTLYAPFSGTVLTKNILNGEKVNAGKEIITIADLTNLWLKADLYESELNKVSLGSAAVIQFSFNPQKTYKGKVTFIYPTVDPITRTVKVRIDLINQNNELKPSMFGNVEIIGEEFRDITTITESAVLRNGKKNLVILSLGKGKFKPVEVDLGLYSDGYYQIISGLKTNDAIVSSGQFMLDSESSLRAAVNLFSSENSIDKMNIKKMDSAAYNRSEEHNHSSSIIHDGIIDVESIDKNGDGKLFECPMDWNIISDKDGRCPVCNMLLKEYTIEEVNNNLSEHGFEHK